MDQHIDTKLIEVCKDLGKSITGLTHKDEPVNGGRLLLTISGLESTFGKRREFVRNEPGYSPGGNYYSKSLSVRQAFQHWGCLAASSFGSFQLMYITATEMGFDGHPIDLQGDRVCGYWATQLIIKRFIGRLGAKTLTDILDCYNSGSHRDHFIPALYVSHGLALYADLVPL